MTGKSYFQHKIMTDKESFLVDTKRQIGVHWPTTIVSRRRIPTNYFRQVLLVTE
jgi:hypothetical protein